MKKSCLLFIAILAASFYGYMQLLKSTPLDHKIWIPALLSIGLAALVANVLAIFMALRQKSGASKPRSDWRDGELVGISGMIQAQRSPIVAPFSGANCAIVEYSIKKRVFTDDGSGGSELEIYNGFLMAPCIVQGMLGSVSLVGFPLTVNIPQETFGDDQAYRRAANYLATASVVEKSSNPMTAIKQLNQVLADDDGQLRADFCNAGETAHITEKDLPLNAPAQTESQELNEQPPTPADEIFNNLRNASNILSERALKNGTEVTVFGTYRAQKQALDIGSGLTNLSHTIQLGSLSANTSKNIRKAVIASIVWALIVGAGNYFVLKSIGINIPL
jgi:hypothetical protein